MWCLSASFLGPAGVIEAAVGAAAGAPSWALAAVASMGAKLVCSSSASTDKILMFGLQYHQQLQPQEYQAQT